MKSQNPDSMILYKKAASTRAANITMHAALLSGCTLLPNATDVETMRQLSGELAGTSREGAVTWHGSAMWGTAPRCPVPADDTGHHAGQHAV